MKTLKVQNLKYLYNKRSTDGINDISFELESSRITSIIGPSGSGKSTTLKLIKGILVPQDGQVLNYESQIGYVAQNTVLNDELTVFELLFKELDYLEDKEKQENQIRATLSTLHITNEIHSKISSISGGQRQRVVIAQALIHNPKVLLLDEAFGHLDQVLRFDLMRDLFEIFRDKEISTLFVTHDTGESLSFSDEVIVMNYGKIIQSASPEKIYKSPKNLFVAKFIGIKNIFITNIVDRSSTELTFKFFNKNINLKKENSFEGNELVIFFRNDAFYIDDNGEYKGKIIERFYYGSYQWFKLKIKNKTIWIKGDSSAHKETINFSVDYNKAHFSSEL